MPEETKKHVGAHHVVVDAASVDLEATPNISEVVAAAGTHKPTVVSSSIGTADAHFDHLNASFSTEFLQVDTDELRRVAESGRAALTELSEIIQTVRELVNATEGYWTGEAAEFFREWVPVGLADFERCVKDLSDYPRELISYADEYEGVITKAEMVAESVQGVEWAME